MRKTCAQIISIDRLYIVYQQDTNIRSNILFRQHVNFGRTQKRSSEDASSAAVAAAVAVTPEKPIKKQRRTEEDDESPNNNETEHAIQIQRMVQL